MSHIRSEPGVLDRKRILIIDDDPSLIESLSAALSPPYAVSAVSDGASALAFLARDRTDLILLDIVLGTEDGLELVPHLRERTPAPILVLTGYGTRANLLRAIRTKPDDFLDKPVGIVALRSRVSELLWANGNSGHPLDRVHAWIAREFHRPLTTECLAPSVNMSRDHLRRAFAERYGLTPREFLEECRMTRAKILLRETDFLTKEVATQVGFADANNFSTVFKRFHSLSPEAFRARHRRSPAQPMPPFCSPISENQRKFVAFSKMFQLDCVWKVR
jgi:YesN/AraC family two-component response regulator